MMLLPVIALPTTTVSVVLSFLATNLDLPPIPAQQGAAQLPVLEVIKVYGRLAGQTCFGKIAPPGSSCQVTASELKRQLGLATTTTTTTDGASPVSSSGAQRRLSRDEFGQTLEGLQFQWPLKPYGVDSSLVKTAAMNKGAETRLYMEQLESRGFYNPRNPAGPLPTSLRPELNAALQKEGLMPKTVDRIYGILAGDGDYSGSITEERTMDNLFKNRFSTDASFDYYDFVKLLGAESITWD